VDRVPVVTAARPLGGQRVHLQFDDGAAGEVDLYPVLERHSPGLLADLLDPAYFARLQVDPELGTIAWPNGIDWDPLVLYSLATGTPLPQRQTA